MWQYNYTSELYHHGVLGMKWGKRRQARLERKVERRYSRYGKKLGMSDYYKDEGKKVYNDHDTRAQAFDKQAQHLESQGHYLIADSAKRSASGLRSRGLNLKAQQDSTAKRYEIRAEKLKEKANKYATKKRVDLGKARIDAIINSSRQKGYKKASVNEEMAREREMEEALGEDGYATYNWLRGKQ